MRKLKVIITRDIRTPTGGITAHKGDVMTMVIRKEQTRIGIDVYYEISDGSSTIKTLDTSVFMVVGVEKK